MPDTNVSSFFQVPTSPELRVDAILCIVFAPIALVIPNNTVDEAMEIANNTLDALRACVFGPGIHPDEYLCRASVPLGGRP